MLTYLFLLKSSTFGFTLFTVLWLPSSYHALSHFCRIERIFWTRTVSATKRFVLRSQWCQIAKILRELFPVGHCLKACSRLPPVLAEKQRLFLKCWQMKCTLFFKKILIGLAIMLELFRWCNCTILVLRKILKTAIKKITIGGEHRCKGGQTLEHHTLSGETLGF